MILEIHSVYSNLSKQSSASPRVRIIFSLQILSLEFITHDLQKNINTELQLPPRFIPSIHLFEAAVESVET
jgi:hypothetical protein